MFSPKISRDFNISKNILSKNTFEWKSSESKNIWMKITCCKFSESLWNYGATGMGDVGETMPGYDLPASKIASVFILALRPMRKKFLQEYY
jgi:hypothetical protein